MKQLSLITTFYILFLSYSYAQNKEFLKSDFSLISEKSGSDVIYYRIQSEKNPNTFVIYNLDDTVVGKEESDGSEEGLITRNILLVYSDLTPKEAHLLEEQKYKSIRQSRYFDEEGNIYREERIEDGVLQYRAYYNEDGKIESEDEILLSAPNGGFQAWNDHLAKHLTYPLNARRTGAQGTVYIRFDVDENGKTSNYEPIRTEGLHPELIKESIRVISIYRSGWIPYSINGLKMDSKVVVPIRFKLG